MTCMDVTAALDAAIESLTANQPDHRDTATVAAIRELRSILPPHPLRPGVYRELADDLLELHEGDGIGLDAWVSAREFVEAYLGPIRESGE